jgi:hypothetical protein
MTTHSHSAKRRKSPPKNPVRDSLNRDAARPPNASIGSALKQPQNRWQRAVRYTWDKNRGRG